MIPVSIPATLPNGDPMPVSLRELQTVLLNLAFLDNFKGFEVVVSVAAGATVTIPNQLRVNGKLVTPTRRIILRETGPGQLVDAATPWTTSNVYLTNAGASTATATVLFLV